MKAVLLALLLTGCTSLRDTADSAMEHGDYLRAAALYDQLAAANPNDASALARRQQARESALRVELVAVQNARAAGHDADALDKLRILLAQRDAWGGQMPAVLGPAVGLEVSAASAKIGGEVAAVTAHDGPLAGEAAEAGYRALLARRDFASARDAMRAQLAQAGAASCTRLQGVATTPYFTWLAAQYCGHWGVAVDVPALPDQSNALAVDGAIANDADAAASRAAIADAFRRSPWFAATAPSAAHATLAGNLAVAYSARDVTLTATWTESVPYTDYETTQESYQEPYDDTESYSEEVPSTEYRTETVPCGDTTCTNTVPETVYHTEWKTRTVTKYRTAYRDVTTPVTRYRDEQHAQDYQAVERDGSYAANVKVHTSGGKLVLDTALSESNSESGYDHDVTIGPAGVSPSRANLTSAADWAAAARQHVAAKLGDQLAASYVSQFCTAPTFTLESAAECAYAGATKLPAPAHAALRTALGGEEPFLRAILAGN